MAVAVLQKSRNNVAARVQRVEEGMADVIARLAKIDSEYVAIKMLFSAKVHVDDPMTAQEVATAG